MEKINIEVSNRHVHLTKETYDLLFDDEMKVVKQLSQKGEFVSDKTVTLKTESFIIEGVKVLGPLRSYDQIEIARSDALKFKLNPPVRRSGDLEGAELITLETSKNKIDIKGCILAQRHIHMTSEDALKYNVTDGQKVSLKIEGERSGIMDGFIKVSDNGVLKVHIDKDESNAFMLNNDDEVELIK